MPYILPAERQRAVDLYKSGLSCARVSAETGYQEYSIYMWVRKAGVSRSRSYPLDTSYFRDINTPTKAYWLGFLAADAGVAAGPKKWCVALTLAGVDREHLEAFRVSLGTTIPIRVTTQQGRQYPRFSVTSVELVKDLIRHGVGPKKSHTLAPWDGPPDLLRHYWRGVWDRDGSFTKVGWMSLVGSRAMMEGFRRYAADILGIEVPIRPHKSIFDLRFWKLAEVAALASHLYRNLDGTPVLARKAARAETAIARRPKLNDWSHLTADGLALLRAQHGTWKKVATALGIKSYCVLWLQRKRLGV